ncbi:MAG: glycerol-3-phosphate 1-O-acyltransferase PlsY [Clostridia bacterium]|nr:glycerol-3-phosphate 1-O-acyltransferase PlsY [Clostridia bacterium]
MDLGIFLDTSESIHIAFPIIFGLISLALGYFLGGINCAIIISRIFYKDDIRNYGSKNAGMTNMLRTYGKGAAAMTLVGDLMKTVLAILLSRLLFGEPGAYIAGLGSVIGHIYPCYFGFKGGKGVAAAAAMILCTNPICFLILLAIFVILVVGYKYVSLGSVMAMMLYPIILNRLGEYDIVPIVCSFAVAILIIWKHKENIKRLLAGTENKIKLSGKKDLKKNENKEENNKE